MVRFTCLSVVLALLLAGCATALQEQELEEEQAEPSPADDEPPGLLEGVGIYFANRGMDLVDVFSARLSVGPGLRASARVTEVVQAGVGMTGPDVTSAAQTAAFPAYQVGWLKREGGVWKARIAEAGASMLYYFGSDCQAIMGNKMKFGYRDRGFFDVGFAVHAALAGVEAETRLDEIADFLLGFFGVDIMHDDS